MPTVNVFSTNDSRLNQISEITDELKVFIAQELTGDDIKLNANEVSVRLMKVSGKGMLADLELEITAHAFEERIRKQDQICLNIRRFLKQKIQTDEIRVWLLLPELGHSWD